MGMMIQRGHEGQVSDGSDLLNGSKWSHGSEGSDLSNKSDCPDGLDGSACSN